MSLIRCSECGNNYPNQLASCPKCGAQTPEEKKGSTQNITKIRYLFAVGLLLILAAIIGMTHFSFLYDTEYFMFSALTFVAGIMLTIYTHLSLLFLKSYKTLFWIFLIIYVLLFLVLLILIGMSL